jgi:Protein of unknown function (DUF2809)
MDVICRRIPYLALLIGIIAWGLISRACPLGWYLWDKSLGDALYAVAGYLFVRLLAPRARVLVAGAVALAWCYGVETFKLTGWPAAWASWRVSRLVLGSTPSWHNIVCYTLGIATAAVVEVGVRRLFREGHRWYFGRSCESRTRGGRLPSLWSSGDRFRT